MNKKLNNQTNVIKTEDIKSVLDSALKFNREKRAQGKDETQNILLIGETGSGKTNIVEDWIKENNLNAYSISSEWELFAHSLETDGYKDLNRPNTILFLDMFDHAPKETRAKLLEFVKTRAVSNPNLPGKKKKIENFLFTVATANPDSPAYNTIKFDEKELDCFKQVEVVMTPQILLNYLTNILNKVLQKDTDPKEIKENKGRLALANAILTNKNFKFDTYKDVIQANKAYENSLCYRNLTRLLLFCDGSKKDLLSKLPNFVGKHSLSMFEEILQDYKD